MSNTARLQAVAELLTKANNGDNKYAYAILAGYFMSFATDEQTAYVEALASDLIPHLQIKKDN